MGKFKVVSLFAGAGGLDWGFHTSPDYEVVFVNEINKSAAQTYLQNYRKDSSKHRPQDLTAIYSFDDLYKADGRPVLYVGDVFNVDFGKIKEIYSNGLGINVVIGGPPCQDFSIVRGTNKKGTTVRRGKLYAHFLRAVKVLQPEVFVFENVPGLKSTKKGVPYRAILKDFTHLNLRWAEVKKAFEKDVNGNSSSEVHGYRLVLTNTIRFSDLGVPQQRQRLIIIGVREDLADKDTAREISQYLQKKLASSVFSKYPMTPIEVFEGLPLNDRHLNDIYVEIIKEYSGIWEEVETDIAKNWKKNVWDVLTKEDVVQDYLISNGISSLDEREFKCALKKHKEILKMLGYYKRPLDRSLKFKDGSHFETLKESESVVERLRHIAFGENYQFVYGTKWSVEGKGISFVYRRLHPLKPAPTVVGRGGGGTRGYHYRRSRATLTNRERARLQTFPDTFLFSGTSPEVRSQIGNAVPPVGSMWLALAVRDILRIID